VDLALKAQGIWLIVLILLIGILGVLMLAGLAAARGRHLARMRALRKPDGAPQDLWKISGDRLSANEASEHDEEKSTDEDETERRPDNR